MEIGDLLYIAFALLSVFFGVFGKKKKNPNQKGGSSFDLNDFIQEAYNDDYLKSSESDIAEQPIRQTEPINTSPQSESYSQKLAQKKADAKARVEKAKRYSSNSPIFQNEISDTVPSSEFEFDAEKAVIYSEIMKRPEY